eukprot:CAMPEP_0113935228 /NCGR_PEP_ID=MMETSP1339-20121228/2413_1 /TAXON_ID=94617 /ORGANISM="Fibrocapsa japonica" /LENGTH=367 /DNA_ID=CAMNT_0000937299 /DNA_START=278 /DNA_END=1381 /DNA_ORIENTATION=+ /assembly_acc=CAM_ASM_000762
MTVKTGGLRGLPPPPSSKRIIESAKKAAYQIKWDKEEKNQRKAARKFAAQRLDTMGKEISKPLSDLLKEYKRTMTTLHPFEATLADLTVRARHKKGRQTLKAVLDDVNSLRARALAVCKEASHRSRNAETKKEALQILEDTSAELEDFLTMNSEVTQELVDIQLQLSRLPVVELHLPTVVLVGAPNVGKSSIVRSVSTGTPEVNNYPFTTRGMTLGHMYHPETEAKSQVMDTPGLLSRPDGERNEMEALTLASMQHLPTAVIFVMDMSGLSGEQSSFEAQVAVREELRSRFPKRPWLDVVSKHDLPRNPKEWETLQSKEWGRNAMSISVKTGANIGELSDRIIGMVDTIEQVLEKIGMTQEKPQYTP